MQIKITWLFVVKISLLLFVIFVLFSVFGKKQGTWTQLNIDPKEIMWYDGRSFKENQKFESKGETICRECLKSIYGVPFPNVRLNLLKNENTGKNLELDCFNKDLNIAVEYNGASHYHFIPYFHKTYDKFVESINRDEYKKIMCKNNGIKLIVVPYNLRHDKICSFITNELKKAGLLITQSGW